MDGGDVFGVFDGIFEVGVEIFGLELGGKEVVSGVNFNVGGEVVEEVFVCVYFFFDLEGVGEFSWGGVWDDFGGFEEVGLFFVGDNEDVDGEGVRVEVVDGVVCFDLRGSGVVFFWGWVWDVFWGGGFEVEEGGKGGGVGFFEGYEEVVGFLGDCWGEMLVVDRFGMKIILGFGMVYIG